MSKTYESASDKDRDVLLRAMKQNHHRLTEVSLIVGMLMVSTDDVDDDGVPRHPVLAHHGVPAIAIARIISLRDRALGMPDCEISIDLYKWMYMDDKERLALLDHELTHFDLVHKDNRVVTDGLDRPKLKMRPHDHSFGWFDQVVSRHGKASQEHFQASQFFESYSQLYLDL